MLRGGTRVLFLRAEIASAELRKLLPLLPSKGQGTTPSTQSVASLLVSTAFANTLTQSPLSHSRDCPVMAKLLPLSRVGVEPSFISRPCVGCVRERVHYLSSVVFCDDFERRCTTGAIQHDAKSHEATHRAASTTGLLEKEVEAAFGSLGALKERLLELSGAAMSPGRLWIVYSPATGDQMSGGLNLLSLPGCKVPLVHGLWPLAVMNVSEEEICKELERRTTETRGPAVASAKQSAPAWSHAARTPSAAQLIYVDTEAKTHAGAVERMDLFDMQTTVAKRALDTVNWAFVEEQLASALAYYSSVERATVRQEHRKEREQLAAVRAMSRLKDSGAVIHAADSVTISSTHLTEPTAAARKETAVMSEAANTAGPQVAVTTNTSLEGAATPRRSDDADAVTRDSESTTSAPASSGPLPVQLADGTWEYRYDSGDVTRVRKDGTKIFQTRDLTTTVYANGDTLFEYPNSTSIMDRADGVRITTYADGTTKEERLR